MEANPWTLVIVGAIILALLVLILIKNHLDKRDFYESLNASNDLEVNSDKSINNIELNNG